MSSSPAQLMSHHRPARSRGKAFLVFFCASLSAQISTYFPANAAVSYLPKAWTKMMVAGQTAVNDDHLSTAKENFEAALALSSGNRFLRRLAQYQLAQVLTKQRRFKEALQLYEADIASRDSNEGALVCSLYGAALCYAELGQPSRCEQYLRRAIKIYDGPSGLSNIQPDKADALIVLLKLYGKSNNLRMFDETSASLKTYLEHLPVKRRMFKTVTVCQSLDDLQADNAQAIHRDLRADLHRLQDDIVCRAQAAPQQVAVQSKGTGGSRCRAVAFSEEQMLLRSQLLNKYRDSDPARYVKEVKALLADIPHSDIEPDSIFEAHWLNELAISRLRLYPHSSDVLPDLERAYQASKKFAQLNKDAIELQIGIVSLLQRNHRDEPASRWLKHLRESAAQLSRLAPGACCDLGDYACDSGLPALTELGITYYSRAIAADSKFRRAYECRCNAYLSLSKFAEALKDNDAAIKLGAGKETSAWNQRVTILTHLGRFDEARQAAKEVSKMGKAAEGHVLLGNIYCWQLHYQQAVDEYSSALKDGARNSDVYLSRANAELQLKEFDEAVKDLNTAITGNQQSWAAYWSRGNVLCEQNKLDAAGADFKRASELAPKETAPLVSLGLVLWRQGLNEEALKPLAQAKSMHCSDPTCYAAMGHCYAALREYDEAIASYTAAINLNPKCGNAFWGLGNVYNVRGRYAESLAALNRTIELMPNQPLCYFDRARARKASGDIDGASSDCHQACILGPNDSAMQQRCESLMQQPAK